MSEIYLIRPGCTDFDDQHRLQGTLNLPLNKRGEAQVERVIEQLRSVPLEVLFVAPFDPAQSTAEALHDKLGVKLKVASEWRNLNLGLWEGLSIDEVRRKYPKVFKQWIDAPETICPPEGETVSEAVERIQKLLAKAVRKRNCFGIVAPEPLATLIRSVLLCERPHFPAQSRRSQDSEPGPACVVERIHCSRLGDPGDCAGCPSPVSDDDSIVLGKQGTSE